MNKRILAALALVASSSALADVLPPPEDMRNVTVKVSSEISAILLDTTGFQKTETVNLPATGSFGPCTASRKTWTGENAQQYAQSITCQDRDSCFYKAQPTCTMGFVAYKGETEFLTVESSTPVQGK